MTELEPIHFSDYDRYTPFFHGQNHRLCVYSLPSLIAWHTREYHPVAGVHSDAFVAGAEFATQKQNRHLILPVSGNGDFPPDKLHRMAREFGFDKYWFVPEDYIQAHGKAHVAAFFTVSRQPEYDDYVYATDDLAGLRGNKYAKKRNLISQFTRQYLDRSRVLIEPLSADLAAECIDFLDEWCEIRDCDYDQDEDLACERRAAINLIEHIEQVHAKGLVARVDGKISAFGIGCRLTDQMGVLHFEKAFPHIKGLYQFFDKLCAERLFNGFAYLNKESDMAVPGLAKAKRSYHPVSMVPCYRLDLQ